MMKINARTILLCDGLGASLSAVMLGIILPAFKPLVGLPISLLHLLATLALLYAAYDFCCLRWADHGHPQWLSAIILANLSHVILTLIYLWVYRREIQTFGVVYFIGEIFVVLVIVVYQVKIVKRLRRLRRSTQ